MTEFQLVEEFQQYLESIQEQAPDYVQRESYFLAKNCGDQGLDAHVPLYPLFLNERITAGYHRFSWNVKEAIDRILDVLMEPEHPLSPRMRDYLTVQPEIEAILRSRPRGGVAPRVIRPDTVLHGSRIIAHEFNVSWPGGISDSDIITDLVAENTLYQGFCTEMAGRGLVIPRQPPWKSTRALLDEVIDASGVEDPTIAVVIPTQDVAPFGADEIPLSQRIVDFFRSQGHDVEFIHPHEVEYDHVAHYRGKKIDVVYRIFEWGHVKGTHEAEYGPLLQAYVDGVLPVVNSFHSEAVSAKSIFELLHAREMRPVFDGMDLDGLLEAIPFTVNLRQVDSPEQFVEEKERWVLKRIKGSASDSVLLGLTADDAAWRHVIDYGLETGNVVAQEYVDSPMMLMSMFPGEDMVQVPRYIDIDPFVFSGRLGNFFARFSENRMTSMVYRGGMFPVVPVGG